MKEMKGYVVDKLHDFHLWISAVQKGPLKGAFEILLGL